MPIDISKVYDVITYYPLPQKKLCYGTAGFRDRFDLPLHSIFVRIGVLASYRSLSVGGKPTGVMITASHNPVDDNGVKVVDYDGGMLSQQWEPLAEKIANVEDLACFQDFINELATFTEVSQMDQRPVVFIGRDTRPHSFELCECVKLGVNALGGIVIDLGEVTTPQLHHAVYYHKKHNLAPVEGMNSKIFQDHYDRMLLEGYNELIETIPSTTETKLALFGDGLIIDASCGVGSIALSSLLPNLVSFNQSGENTFYEVCNESGSGPVNEDCGAELVQKNRTLPRNVNTVNGRNKLMCSLDGDADRIVFHYFLPVDDTLLSPEPSDVQWILLDGDKIAGIISLFLIKEIEETPLIAMGFTIGVVQTAYANGSSTEFYRRNNIPVVMAKTGVKYLHHKAVEFDIGIYFEANGHGTVIFSPRLVQYLNSYAASNPVNREALAIIRLKACVKLINQAVGDAISDLLITLAALQILNMSVRAWHELYNDLPSKMIKFPIPDKSVIECSDDETKALKPTGLQNALDEAMTQRDSGRCFVRPSGTEDVVRIYAEAATASEVELLISAAKEAVAKYCA